MDGNAGDLKVEINPASVRGVLLRAVLLLAVLGAAAALARDHFGYKSLYGFVPLFDLDAEGTIPSFFSALLLLSAAILLGLVATARTDFERRWRHRWGLLAVGFAYLSLDEMVGIHERLNRPIREMLGEPGFATAWVAPGVAVVLVLAVLYLPFLLALPRRHALAFVAAGCLYLFGALALEAVAGEIIEAMGKATLLYHSEVVAEESCEMLGVVFFIGALLRYLAEIGVTVGLARPAARAAPSTDAAVRAGRRRHLRPAA
ncbi:MAG: hypothetical protein KDG89_15925 [Geminicoccaceae bacterium]|nr:hypothetical protein [Geminicoccaceae bacterium]